MSYFNKKRFTMRQVVGLLTIVFLGIAVIAYAAMTKPHNFMAGDTIRAGEVNKNFDDLYNAMPAAKQSTPSGTIQLTATAANVTSITVTPPVAGYIILTGNGTVEIDPVTAGAMQARVYLSTASAGTSATDFAWFGYGDTTGVGSYVLHPFSITRIFPVAAGANTFYMTGNETVGAATHSTYVSQATLTAVFVPSLLP